MFKLSFPRSQSLVLLVSFLISCTSSRPAGDGKDRFAWPSLWTPESVASPAVPSHQLAPLPSITWSGNAPLPEVSDEPDHPTWPVPKYEHLSQPMFDDPTRNMMLHAHMEDTSHTSQQYDRDSHEVSRRYGRWHPYLMGSQTGYRQDAYHQQGGSQSLSSAQFPNAHWDPSHELSIVVARTSHPQADARMNDQLAANEALTSSGTHVAPLQPSRNSRLLNRLAGLVGRPVSNTVESPAALGSASVSRSTNDFPTQGHNPSNDAFSALSGEGEGSQKAVFSAQSSRSMPYGVKMNVKRTKPAVRTWTQDEIDTRMKHPRRRLQAVPGFLKAIRDTPITQEPDQIYPQVEQGDPAIQDKISHLFDNKLRWVDPASIDVKLRAANRKLVVMPNTVLPFIGPAGHDETTGAPITVRMTVHGSTIKSNYQTPKQLEGHILEGRTYYNFYGVPEAREEWGGRTIQHYGTAYLEVADLEHVDKHMKRLEAAAKEAASRSFIFTL